LLSFPNQEAPPHDASAQPRDYERRLSQEVY
jgi:hypothetical protein